MTHSDLESREKMDEVRAAVQEQRLLLDGLAMSTREVKHGIDSVLTHLQNDRNLTKIRRRFDLEADYSWSKRYVEISRTRAKGTGEWLLKDSSLERWSSEDSILKTLVLQEDPGCGKTHVANVVIHHLQWKVDDSRSPKPLYVAYYYFNKKKDYSFERCLGSLVYQFAEANPSFAKNVVDTRIDRTNVSLLEHNWKLLVTGLQGGLGGTYFICIDGYDTHLRSSDAAETIAVMIETHHL